MGSELEGATVAPTMNAQQLAKTLFELATSGLGKHSKLSCSMMSELERAVVMLAPTMNSGDLRTALWAFATLAWQAEPIQTALEGATVRLAPIMTSQEVGDSLWALATLGWQAGEDSMRFALEGAAVRVAPSMNAQEVVNTLWALATLGWRCGEGSVRCALEGAAVRVAPIMNAQHVANTLWAAATLRWEAGAGSMWSALEGAVVRLAPGMNERHVANTLWALATLLWPMESLTKSVLKKAVAGVALRMNVQAVASTLWGLAVLGWQADRDMAAAFKHRCSLMGKAATPRQELMAAGPSSPTVLAEAEPMELCTKDLSQLLQAHLASHLLGLHLVTLPSSILLPAVQAYREQTRNATVSNGQREVADSLCRLGIAHELEYITADGLFSIDLAIVDRRIAVEFDGPSHFTVNSLEPLGRTHLRHRLISAIGWLVVSIPFFEWDRFRQSNEQDAYVWSRVDSGRATEYAQPEPMPHMGVLQTGALVDDPAHVNSASRASRRSQKGNDSSERSLAFIAQNVRGLSATKLECLFELMTQSCVYAAVITETKRYAESDAVEYPREQGTFLVFYHGSEVAGRCGRPLA